MTEEKRLSLGINVSILLILMIFGVLLSLPLRLLFNTSYSDRSAADGVAEQARGGGESVIPMDHRRLRRCPNLEYENRLMSVFLDDYDGNCTYAQNDDDDDDDDDNDDDNENDNDDDGDDDDGDNLCDCKDEEDSRREKKKLGRAFRKGSSIEGELKEDAEEILRSRQMKSVNVAGHILVAMLLVSVIAAFVEVLRIRFAREKVLRQSIMRKLLSSLALEFGIVGCSVGNRSWNRSRRQKM